MKYKPLDKVRIKSLDWYNENKDEDGNIRYKHGTAYPIFFTKYMSRFCSETLTIKCVHKESYYMNETGSCEFWTDEMIEGLVEDEMPLDKAGQITDFEYEGLAYTLPDGYQFVDENGNVINATKIVLEKKKKEYPKTFLGCCDVLGIEDLINRGVNGYRSELLDAFQKLHICRDAYWKIAGEEMGLGGPWEPDFEYDIYYIYYDTHKRIFSKDYCAFGINVNHFLVFPTEEMRDAFYENFKVEIESVKELL